MSPWHWALVVAVAILLFGAKRLPDAARSLGRSARILKSELRGDDEPAPTPAPPSTTPAPTSRPTTPPPTASAAPSAPPSSAGPAPDAGLRGP